MTFEPLGRWRLPIIAVASLLIALVVVGVILLVGQSPGPSNETPTPMPTRAASPSADQGDTPEAAVRAFFEAFAEARGSDDPELIEPFVNGTDSPAYQTAAGFLLGQRDAGKASVVTVQELTDFRVEGNETRAVVSFTLVEGGYDIDLESREPLESPVVLPSEQVQAELVRTDDGWVLDRYGAVEE